MSIRAMNELRLWLLSHNLPLEGVEVLVFMPEEQHARAAEDALVVENARQTFTPVEPGGDSLVAGIKVRFAKTPNLI